MQVGRPRPKITFVHWRPNTLTHYRPHIVPGNPRERRSLDFFRSNSAVQLAGYFDSAFWCRLVLQACHEEPIIQHAVTALGALYESTQGIDANNLKSGRVYDQFALQQYNKAIGLLHQNLRSHSQGKGSFPIALISCLLFIAFESIQGNHEASLTHMRSGLLLFRNWQAENNITANSSPDQQDIDSELVHMFSSLEVTALALNDQLSADILLQDVKHYSCSIPEFFDSLSEARDLFRRCTYVMLGNSIRKKQHHAYPGLAESQIRQTHRELVSQWLSAFRAFIGSNKIGIGHKDFSRTILLEQLVRCAGIVADVGMSPKETDFDAYHTDFETIVALASSLINNVDYPSVVRGTLHFSFDGRILFTLYFVTTRCRDPWIRRQALSLLSATHRLEGFWDSEMLSRIAERIISIEEDVQDIRNIKISKSDEVLIRLTISQMTIFSQERKVLLKFIRTKTGISEQSIQYELIAY